MMKQILLLVGLFLLFSGCSHLGVGHRGVAPAGTKDRFVHVVTFSGENFGRIAAWYTGNFDNWKAIERSNPQLSVNNLQIGEKVSVPGNLVITTAPMPQSFLRSALRVQTSDLVKADPARAEVGRLSKLDRKAGRKVSAKSTKVKPERTAKMQTAAKANEKRGEKKVDKKRSAKPKDIAAASKPVRVEKPQAPVVSQAGAVSQAPAASEGELKAPKSNTPVFTCRGGNCEGSKRPAESAPVDN